MRHISKVQGESEIMVMVGDAAPDFVSTAYQDGEFRQIKMGDFRGKWVILFFYPADFTFVCPTELEGFSEDFETFRSKEAEIISVSTDTEYTHMAWTKADKRLSGIRYPMVADRKGDISRAYNVYNEKTGNAMRGLFVIDPDGVIRYMVVTDDAVGRSTEETLRVLAALQSGGLCPVNWKEGEQTLNSAV